MLRDFISSIFLLLCLLPLSAREVFPERKVCILDVVDLSENSTTEGDASAFREIFKDNFAYELSNAGFVMLDDRSWKTHQGSLLQTDLLDEANILTLGEKAGADVVIAQFIRLDDSRILYGIKCYDVEKGLLAASVLKSGRAGLSLTSTINNTIKEIIPQIKRSMNPLSQVGQEYVVEVYKEEKVDVEVYESTVNYVTVTIKSADEGARLFAADALVGEIKAGSFTFKVPEESFTLLTLRKEGYVDKDIPVHVQTEGIETVVPSLKKSVKEALKGEYAVFQLFGAGIGYRYYFIPDWFFAEAQDYLYFQYDFSSASQPLIHNDINLSLGHYLYFDPDTPVRLSLYAGGGWILTAMFRPDFSVYGDFYRDVLGATVEWNLGDLKFYYKQGGRYTYGGLFMSDLLGEGWWPYTSLYMALGGIIRWH